jgi:phage terminase large subunit-like protein
MSFHARDVANMSEADRAAFLASLTPTEAEDLQYDWEHWARPEQRLPDGDWINWLILAGRGMGKTRAQLLPPSAALPNRIAVATPTSATIAPD